MNGLGKPIRKKNPIQKIEKLNITVKLRHVNKKPIPRKRFIVQTPFSHSTSILEQKNHAAKALNFSLQFLLQRDQKHYSNLTSEFLKMCEQIFKKNSAHIQFKVFEL